MVSQRSVEKRYMEPKPGFALQQLWADSESAITQKTSPSYEVKDNDIRRAVMAITAMPAATLPENAFILALGTPALRTVPPQTGSLAQRAIEEWERNLCENKAVAIVEQMQAGRPFFFCRRPLPFGGSHLRLPSGPAGIRTTTGSLSALARLTPYQLSHRSA